MRFRPAISRHTRLFLWLALPTALYGIWLSMAPFEITWWEIESRPATDIDRYGQLRPYAERALRIDYLMDITPEGAIEHPGRQARIHRRQRNTGQRFRAQYALAPSIVYRVTSLHAVRQRASLHEPYYLILDSAFHATLRDVLKVLRPIARKRQNHIDIHEVEGQYTLIVVKREGEEPLPYWAAPVDG